MKLPTTAPEPPVKPNFLIALGLAGGLVSVFVLAWVFIPGVHAQLSPDACQEAATYHFQRATLNTTSDYDFRAGIAYDALATAKQDCTGWRLDEEGQ